MNKIAVIAMSALTAFVGWCGWLAYHYEGGNDNSKGLYAPNIMHRVQRPPPIAGIEPAGQQDAMKQLVATATGWHDELQINGKQIVVNSRGNMLDPDRHDMAHYLYRVEHKLTQTRDK